MTLGPHFLKGLLDDAVPANQISDPFGDFDNKQVGHVDIVHPGDLHVRIDKEVEGKLFSLSKAAVRGRTVQADSQYDRIFLCEFPVKVAEPASFDGSTGGSILGEEKKYDVFFAQEVIPSNFLAILVECAEAGCDGADFEHLEFLVCLR